MIRSRLVRRVLKMRNGAGGSASLAWPFVAFENSPLRVDAVDKVTVPDSYLDSMLLTRDSKNVCRQHRSLADVSSAHRK